MSLDLINHTLTTYTTDKKGITTWSNPVIDVSIDSTGKVFKRGKLYKGNFGPANVQMKYRVVLVDGNTTVNNNVSFNSLFSRMVLGVKLGAKTICLKDVKAGYSKDNVSFVSCRQGTTFKRPINQLDLIKQQPTEVIEAQQETALNTKQYYTLYEAKNEHITEDGAVFPTKELAEWHQTNVSKGKGNAQIVLDYNGGYVLAEQIFLQEVKYNKERPYVNFIDVMNNNNGVVSNVQEEHCVFDKLGDLTRIMNIGLTEVIGLKTTQSQAIKIQEALDSYIEIEEKFNNSVLRLKSLVKQVK